MRVQVVVPEAFVLEATDEMAQSLHRALEGSLDEVDWNRVEALAGALHDLAQTWTKP